MDQFEAYFRRADLDGDGRISGAEAVAFLQGSNLPRPVLAQVWTIADQNRSGFLGKPEFFNALKLVTVAQSKRDLTPDIVKAALYGPAASKIPAPQINLPAAAAPPAPQVNPMAAAVSAPQQMGGALPQSPAQNLGFRGPGAPNPTMNHQYFPSQQGQTMRPPQGFPPGTAPRPTQGIPGQQFPSGAGMLGQSQPVPTGTASRPPQFVSGGAVGAGSPNSNMLSDWQSGRAGGALTGPRGVSPSTPAASSLPLALSSVSPSPSSTSDSKALVVSGNGFQNDSFFGGDVFSATPTTMKQQPSQPSYSASQPPVKSNSLDSLLTATSMTASSTFSGPQLTKKSNSLESLQSAFTMQPLGDPVKRTQSLPTSGQQFSASISSSPLASGVSVGVGISPDNSQPQWPKMKPSDIQKYTKVFLEVDTDRDGRITGEQARNLFLSWRLPREILKQVWDLSDQDGDSMLSLREFCFALYLMERYREGRPLPASLPSNVMYDETLLSMTGQPKVNHPNAAWGPQPGFGQQTGMGARPVAPASGLRPPTPVAASQPDGTMLSTQQRSREPVLADSFLNQHETTEQNSANSMLQEGTVTEKKADEPQKVILDSKEKLEFYRSKMQDLVLYKSRCDNRLNEITERAIADKREAELLGKKYEEKYKQVAEVASKLTIEEATFRETQERKLELHQALINMEQGGSADGILQVRADRIQSDLDELMKALIERSKRHGLEVKSTAMIELPPGWQPGFPEGAATWDEEWDKFEDEGFSNDLMVDVKDAPGSKSTTTQKERASADGSLTPDSLSNGNGKLYSHSEDELATSPQDSPAGRGTLESPSQEYSDVFEKSTEADAETHRSFDESTWGGAFDTNDDVDSIWGFNPSSNKELDSEKHRDFFDSDDFGLKPIRTESTSAENAFQKKSPFFEDSVPGTPQSRFGNSPRYSEAGDHFDNYSRFDSFSMHDGGGFSPQGEKLTRFDSMNSTKDFGHGHSRAFSSFDDSDPFGSSGPFKVSSDNQTPKKGSDSWSSF
ncbi:hypothetical protein Tsubulata_035014 [Turnera subulata]|uniref:Uncharacterized protein n=1 Tax=Turnera subulata TaxID=218843 RepID=A0A9Q0FVV2_9ROSI|nr:hypothetical protein Tsubulata_035014 [Turnera subulata]